MITIKSAAGVKIQSGGFNRLISHFDNYELGFITAFRGEYDKSENKKRNKQLEADLKASGLGYVKVRGGFTEDFGKPTAQDVTEDTFVVINTKWADHAFKEFMIKLCGKYNQDAVLISEPRCQDQGKDRAVCRADNPQNIKVTARYYDKNGGIDFEFDGLTTDRITAYFTEVSGRKFTLENSAEIESSIGEGEFPRPNVNSVAGVCKADHDYKRVAKQVFG